MQFIKVETKMMDGVRGRQAEKLMQKRMVLMRDSDFTEIQSQLTVHLSDRKTAKIQAPR
jgi:hypothetical protein